MFNDAHMDFDYQFLMGKLIIAMPYMPDAHFNQCVIYVCGHDSTGAMGLIVNKPLKSVNFMDLLEQMDVSPVRMNSPQPPIRYGGPVEVGRGFVLHTADYIKESTVLINNHFALTATLDVLRAINHDTGPKNSILALGYVGWTAGQLEQEIQENCWLIIDATPDLIFNLDSENLWRLSMASIGVSPEILSLESGHA